MNTVCPVSRQCVRKKIKKNQKNKQKERREKIQNEQAAWCHLPALFEKKAKKTKKTTKKEHVVESLRDTGTFFSFTCV